jgi:hypothetical protein
VGRRSETRRRRGRVEGFIEAERIRCPLCIKEDITFPAEEVEYIY